jgi:glycosyltransferase involved in cell wall biosynthesis
MSYPINKKSLSLLSWAYNEEELIEDFIIKALKCLKNLTDDYELIIVDDGSKDNTVNVIQKYASQNDKIKVVLNHRNLNVGTSCRKAISISSKDILFWQTIDWSYDLSRIHEYLNLVENNVIVQGVRNLNKNEKNGIISKLKNINTRSDNIFAAVISIINYLLIRILFGVNFSDFQNITFYPRKIAQSIELTSTSSFVNPELLIKSYYMDKILFIEVPIPFIKRAKGKAKGRKISSLISSLYEILKGWITWGLYKKIVNKNKNKNTIKSIYEF